MPNSGFIGFKKVFFFIMVVMLKVNLLNNIMSTITIEVDEKHILFVKTLLEHLKGVTNVMGQEGDRPYNPAFVKSVQEGRGEYKRGECATIFPEDLWK